MPAWSVGPLADHWPTADPPAMRADRQADGRPIVTGHISQLSVRGRPAAGCTAADDLTARRTQNRWTVTCARAAQFRGHSFQTTFSCLSSTKISIRIGTIQYSVHQSSFNESWQNNSEVGRIIAALNSAGSGGKVNSGIHIHLCFASNCTATYIARNYCSGAI